MILPATVVFLLLPIIGRGAERGESCTNKFGQKATCTNIYSCKAAIDAVALNASVKLYASGIVCGYDTEPLVCCRTVADFNEATINNIASKNNAVEEPVADITESSLSTAIIDLNISSNNSVLNESALGFVELPNNSTQLPPTEASFDVRISPNRKATVATTESSDEVIFTSSPVFLPADSTPVSPPVEASVSTTNSIAINSTISSEVSESPDALPLQSNETNSVTSRDGIPDQPITSATSEISVDINSESSSLDTATTPSSFSDFTASTTLRGFTTDVPINKVLPDRNTCGFQKKRDRLADAYIASIDEFPWVALLKYQDLFGYDAGFRCAGTLITNRYVITAASCAVTGPELFKLTSVRLGEWSLSSPNDCVFDHNGEECPDKAIDVKVENVVPYSNYGHINHGKDIALVRMKKEVQFTDYVRPICLPVDDLDVPLDNTYLTTSGWGATTSGWIYDIKSKIKLPALSREKCSNALLWFTRVFENQHCVTALSRNNVCKTDSGGPLMIRDEEDKPQWYLEGIIPEGFYCDERGSVGVYTRVTKYISWIVTTLTKNNS